MLGIHSFAALAAFTVSALNVNALPQVSRHRHQEIHAKPFYTTTGGASTLTDEPVSFPTLSIPHSQYTSNTAPYGYAASGFAAPTGTSQPYSTGAPTVPHPHNRTNGTATSTRSYPDKFHGVNLGAWLILEPWMTPDVFEGTHAVDQWTFDSTPGAAGKLQQHWSTYITEGDFKNMSSWGINAVRIPIGYWAYNNTGTPYITGADAYLEKAIGWARQYGIWVMVDCHGSPGSQNGAMHSGRTGAVSWQTDDNLELSIEVLQTIAKKYGSMEYADVVMGIELVNEPKIGDDGNSLSTTQWWAGKAYSAVKAAAENKDIYILHHDGFTGVSSWTGTGAKLNGNATLEEATFGIDLHLYQNQDDASKALNLTGHIDKACNYVNTDLLPLDSTLPVFVGEFSAQIDIEGCTDGDWSQELVNGTRQFFEAQIDAFEHSSRGWFIWSLKQGSLHGAWCLEAIMESVYQADKITDRKYPGICPFG